MGVAGAADVAEQRHPVGGLAHLAVEPGGLADPRREQARPQLRLERLAEGVVLRERERGDEFTEAERCVQKWGVLPMYRRTRPAHDPPHDDASPLRRPSRRTLISKGGHHDGITRPQSVIPSRSASSRTRRARSRSSGSPTPTWPGWSSATSTPRAACSAGTSSCTSRTARPTTPSPRPRRAKLVEQDHVDVIFGGIYSSTRQAIKGPAVVEGKTLYIYPEQYEGQESDPLIFCTGPVPAQQVDPFIPWLMRETGAKTFYLPSADYIWPHVMNARVREVVTAHGGDDRRRGVLPARSHGLPRDGRADHRERRRRRVQHDRAARASRRSSSSCTSPASRSAAGSWSARTSTRTS